MAQKQNAKQRKQIVEAALSLAGKGGWAKLTFAAIAKKAKLKTGDIEKQFSDVWDILIAALSDIEIRTQEKVENYLSDNWHDNLMEILMTRFDLAEAHRVAFSSLVRDIPRRPKVVRRLLPAFYGTMQRMLELSGAPAQPLTIVAFGGLYLSIVDTWIKDDSRDKSKTMAAIDKRLGLFESFSGYLSCKK